MYTLSRFCPELTSLQLGVRLNVLEKSLLPVDVDTFTHTIVFLVTIILRAPPSLTRLTIGLDVQLYSPENNAVSTFDADVAHNYYGMLDRALTSVNLPNLRRVSILKNTKGADGEWRQPVETGVRRGLVRILKNAHEKSDLLQFNPEER